MATKFGEVIPTFRNDIDTIRNKAFKEEALRLLHETRDALQVEMNRGAITALKEGSTERLNALADNTDWDSENTRLHDYHRISRILALLAYARSQELGSHNHA